MNHVNKKIESQLREIDDLEEAHEIDEAGLAVAYDLLSELYAEAGDVGEAGDAKENAMTMQIRHEVTSVVENIVGQAALRTLSLSQLEPLSSPSSPPTSTKGVTFEPIDIERSDIDVAPNHIKPPRKPVNTPPAVSKSKAIAFSDQGGFDQGFDQGFKQGLNQGFNQGFEQGFDEDEVEIVDLTQQESVFPRAGTPGAGGRSQSSFSPMERAATPGSRGSRHIRTASPSSTRSRPVSRDDVRGMQVST